MEATQTKKRATATTTTADREEKAAAKRQAREEKAAAKQQAREEKAAAKAAKAPTRGTLCSVMYAETIAEVRRVAEAIEVSRSSGDGRIDSAMKEVPFLEEMRRQLLEAHPSWDVVVSPPRAACDVLVNSIRINLKLTDCKSSDNSMNKPSVYYSVTGLTTYPYSSTWNDFLGKLNVAKTHGDIKTTRDKATEYHYLVKNKLTGDVLFKPIFDIHTYVSNPSNDLQINWKNEFEHRDYAPSDEEYVEKVQSLLKCIQESVRQMIARTRDFAEADLGTLFT